VSARRAGLPFAALLAAILVAPAAPAGAADEMHVLVKNLVGRAIVVELHGETKVWPGGDQLYMFEKGERKSFPIDCTEDEKICYGAWLYGDDRVSWGVGPENDRDCEDCCFSCVDSTIHVLEMKP
jgi:hypothetical protein